MEVVLTETTEANQTTASSLSIEELRTIIDALDDQIVPLLLQRLEIAKEIGAYKAANDLPIKDREREMAVLRRLSADIPADKRPYIETVYSGIFASCTACQRSEQ